MKTYLSNLASILIIAVTSFLLSACNKPEPFTPVDISKLPPIPGNELKAIEDYVNVIDKSYIKDDEADSERKRRYLFDKENRVIIRAEKHLMLNNEEIKEYVQKKYNDKFREKAIEGNCGGTESRTFTKILLKNHISSKLVEQDKDGNEVYSWTISPSEHCRGVLKELDIQY